MGRWHSEVTRQLIADDATQLLSLMMWGRLPARYQRFWLLPFCLVMLSGCLGAHRQGVQTDPAKEHYTRALQYLAIGAGEQAVKELNDAIKVDPTNAEFHNTLAFAYHYEGRYQFALTHYAKALELAPEYAEAHVNLAALYLDLGRWDDAVAQGREALKIATYQSPEKAYNNIGLAYMGKGI